MGNMSYCRFENTSKEMRDCIDVLRGEDEYTQSLKDLGDYEKAGYVSMKEMCEEFLDVCEEFEEREPAENEDEE